MRLVEHVQSQLVRQIPLQLVQGQGVQGYRYGGVELGQDDCVATVLLHGIGSGSGSWIYQLDAADLAADPLAQSHPSQALLAWDAPGYGDSTPLPMPQPSAQDYGQRLWQWLDAMGIGQVRLVGHSLGGLMAASAAQLQPDRVLSLTLLAPAQGYGNATADVRNKKRDERLRMLAELGVSTMAKNRAPHLLAAQADKEHVALAEHMMASLHPAGYAQATHMLAQADILADLQKFKSASKAPIIVACGELDNITPPAVCKNLADNLAVPYVPLRAVGHLCAVEAHGSVNRLLQLAGN